MDTSALLVTIGSSVISGLLGVGISINYYRRFERKKEKADTARALIGNRFDMHGDAYTKALNELIFVFHDSPAVMQRLRDFQDAVNTRPNPNANERLISLFKAVCEDVGIKPHGMNDTAYLQAFNPRASSTGSPVTPPSTR